MSEMREWQCWRSHWDTVHRGLGPLPGTEQWWAAWAWAHRAQGGRAALVSGLCLGALNAQGVSVFPLRVHGCVSLEVILQPPLGGRVCVTKTTNRLGQCMLGLSVSEILKTLFK